MASYLCECVDAWFTDNVTFLQSERNKVNDITTLLLVIGAQGIPKDCDSWANSSLSSGFISSAFSTSFITKFIRGFEGRTLALCINTMVGYISACTSGLSNNLASTQCYT